MKLSGRDAARFFARPDAARAGLLIFGADAVQVAQRRRQVIASLIGPEGEAEMRLARMSGADVRRDPARLADALRSPGFFPGPRVAFVEDATDGLTDIIGAVLADRVAGDAVLIVTAGALTAKSPLRKLFEAHPDALAAALYDDPPDREDIVRMLAVAGLMTPGTGSVSDAAMAELTALSRQLDPGDFRQTVAKAGLYKFNDPTPLSPADIAAIAPGAGDAGMDDLLHLVAEGRTTEVGVILRRLEAQGTGPVSMCIAATRHFRALHAARSDPGGVGAGIARMRPPVFGPRRDRMQAQAQAWSVPGLETALAHLVDTDLVLRSSSRAPAMAVLERAFLRLSQMPRGH